MELEALKSKFNDALGSTKLQLSDRTLDSLLQDALAEIGDNDSLCTDEFLARKVNLAKSFSGQVNHEVSTRVEDFKKNYKPEPKPKDKPKPEDGNGEPEWFKAYRKEQEEKFEKMETERKAKEALHQKESVMKSVTDGLKKKFSEAGIECNQFILKTTMKDVEIPSENADVDAIIKSAETSYYKNLKDAGLDTGKPTFVPGSGGGNGATPFDSYFAEKAQREGWAKHE